MLRIFAFGGLRIELQGRALQRLPRSARDLLSYLILHHDRSLSRDLLAGIFWSDRPDSRARRALSQSVWLIRAALGPAADRLVTEPESLAFALRVDDWFDVAVFEATAGDFDASANALERSVSLYCADFLEGCYDDWALLERERLREIYLGTLERLANVYKQTGECEKALAYARQLSAADPLRESSHREVMRLCHLLGRGDAALRQYQVLCRTLSEELDVEPLQETTLIAQQIAAEMDQASLPHLPLGTMSVPAIDHPERLPLVGRVAERATLLAYLDAAIDNRGGLVLIEGEAGVGKTRLLRELAKDAQWRGVEVGWGRGFDLSDLAPYGVWGAVMRSVLSPLRVGQLAALMEESFLNNAARVFPGLAETLSDVPADAQLGLLNQQRERLLEGLAQTAVTLGEIAPHLLILDDLQWADDATLAVLEHLIHYLDDSRLLIIGSYRGEEARERRTVWNSLQRLDRIGGQRRLLLTRLTGEQTAQLVAYGLGMAPVSPAFEVQVYQETDGNPLFVVATLQELRDEGRLFQDERNAWRTAWDEGTTQDLALPLPAGVRRVIQRRLARLSPIEETALAAAAILGGGFDTDMLSMTSQLDNHTSIRVVGELVRRGLLVEETTSYQFSHDKIQEVAYASIDVSVRRSLHVQAGLALETLKPDGAEQLAHHFLMGQTWDKAAIYSREAGQRARDVYASGEAFEFFSRSIESWRQLKTADVLLGLNLHEERGRLCQEIGRFDQAEADFLTALRLAEQIDDQGGQARNLNHMSYLRFQCGDYQKAAESARQGLELADAAGLPDGMATGLFCQANAARQLGDQVTAISLYERAAGIFEMLGDQTALADCLNRMGGALMVTGAYAKAQVCMESALAARRRLDDRVGVSYSLTNLTALYSYMGQFARAQAAGQEALAIATDIGDLYGEDGALHNLGESFVRQGLPEQALPWLRRGLEIARQIGDRATETEALGQLGAAWLRLGEWDEAQKALEQSLSLVSASVESYISALVYANLAELHLATGNAALAMSHAQKSLQSARQEPTPFPLGVALRVLGVVAAQHGSDDAVSYLDASIRTLREIGAQAELARSLVALGLHLRGMGDSGEARRATASLEEAQHLFECLDMESDLAALDVAVTDCLLSGQVRVRLVRAGVPTGRPLRQDDYAEVTWTLTTPNDDAIHGKVARRHHRLLRLLREAADQDAAATVPDLAEALGISLRSVERDLAALRAAGHDPRTRGSRATV